MECELFLGLKKDRDLDQLMAKIPEELKTLFFSKQGGYLQQLQIKDEVYLGKYLGSVVDVSELDLCIANVTSLFNKFIPEYQVNIDDLRVLPVIRYD